MQNEVNRVSILGNRLWRVLGKYVTKPRAQEAYLASTRLRTSNSPQSDIKLSYISALKKNQGYSARVYLSLYENNKSDTPKKCPAGISK